jgi:hypothetical protein
MRYICEGVLIGGAGILIAVGLLTGAYDKVTAGGVLAIAVILSIGLEKLATAVTKTRGD